MLLEAEIGETSDCSRVLMTMESEMMHKKTIFCKICFGFVIHHQLLTQNKGLIIRTMLRTMIIKLWNCSNIVKILLGESIV